MLKLKDINIIETKATLATLPDSKLLINTINAYSYNTAQKDDLFADALSKGHVLIPDGISIVIINRLLRKQKMERIAGADLFDFEMNKLNTKGGKCFFLGSSEKTLDLICKRATYEYPNIKIETYSPPYKVEFTDEENKVMIDMVNKENPDLLWIGMTAPKQEKWAYTHFHELNVNCHIGTIGAVFDFYAGTVKRAPVWLQNLGLEWFYRFLKEPKRLWRRYILGNIFFLYYTSKELIYFK